MFPALQQKTATLLGRVTRLIPHFCALCHQAGPSGICDSCLRRYFTEPDNCCSRCAHPMESHQKNDAALCGACLKRPPNFDRMIAVCSYAPPLDQLLQSFKFGGNLALAPLFAQLLETAVRKHFPDGVPLPSVLTCVPLAPGRLAARGFNQALEMAKPLSRLLGIPLMPHLVERIRETEPQTTIAVNRRRKNVRDAFAINHTRRREIQGQHIGIVDDVLTTGETMNELARTLKRGGAGQISGFVFARTAL